MLEKVADWVVINVFSLEATSRAAETVRFFVNDIVEIFALLILITLFMSVLRFVFPLEKMRDFLSSHKLFGLDYFLAVSFGAVTPFCSCSSIPLFIGFLGAGIPLGVTFAFLITSPLINELAVALLIGLFGWKVTAIYVGAGLLVGMAGGYIIGRLGMEGYVEDFVKGGFARQAGRTRQNLFSREAVLAVSHEVWGIIKKVAPYVFLGVALGAIIHGYVPQGYFEEYLGKDNPLAVPAAVIIGVPFYAGAHSVIPIIQPLVDKGVPLGTALAFMMAVVGLSFPEMLILKKVMRWPLLAVFFAVAAGGMIAIGYGLNVLGI